MRIINQTKRTEKVANSQSTFRKELELLEGEVNYFEKALEGLKQYTIGDTTKSLQVAQFISKTHHFKRVVKRLLEELNLIHREIAEEVMEERKINAESFKDHQYFVKEMEDLHPAYKEYKYTLRTFVASFEHLTEKS